MKNKSKSNPKICILSNSGNSSLFAYIHTESSEDTMDISFKEFNTTKLKSYRPDIIVVDQYFSDATPKNIMNILNTEFNDVIIYFLAPKYSEYCSFNRPADDNTHYFSNFSMDVLNHINEYISTGTRALTLHH